MKEKDKENAEKTIRDNLYIYCLYIEFPDWLCDNTLKPKSYWIRTSDSTDFSHVRDDDESQ